jgi:hypothetical protein
MFVCCLLAESSGIHSFYFTFSYQCEYRRNNQLLITFLHSSDTVEKMGVQ